MFSRHDLTTADALTLPARFDRALVLGCGGIGGVVATKLARAGVAVTAITSNEAITEAIQADGLRAFYDDAFHQAPADHLRAEVTPDALAGQGFPVCLVAVPPNAAEEAVRRALPALAEDAPVVCFPNGLIEERLAAAGVPRARLVGGVVSFGGTMLEPGRVKQTSRGGFTMGPLDATVCEVETLDALGALLSHVGPVQVTENLRGARWSKLAINCAISSLGTIGGDRLGALMRYRHVRRLALEVMTEVVAIAHAEGVSLEKVAGTLDLDWMALGEDERLRDASPGLVARHTILLAVGAKFRNMRSSMLSAIERGRTPPVDQLNGEITSRGLALGIPTPINAALQDTVHRIARGELQSSHETLRLVYAQTRPALRELNLVA